MISREIAATLEHWPNHLRSFNFAGTKVADVWLAGDLTATEAEDARPHGGC
ncbi:MULTISPECIES: hypothetical protein [Mycolicibacter]|uniref:hypothetical protein n=1 Tax=Mycolicibacter TaxID=1073531 RepID=UPI000ADFBCCB|nr:MULTISPECIES: hypothetical protein [Mycolicibacter]